MPNAIGPLFPTPPPATFATPLHPLHPLRPFVQARRDSMLNAIKTGRAQVLVATDVAARGLDVKTVKQVRK